VARVEGGRRRGLRVEAVGGGAMGASSWGQGSGCRVERGEESEMRTQARKGEGTGEVEKRRTTRHASARHRRGGRRQER